MLEVVPVSGAAVSEPDQGRVRVCIHRLGSVAQARVAANEGRVLLELGGVVVKRLVENPQVEAPEGGHGP